MLLEASDMLAAGTTLLAGAAGALYLRERRRLATLRQAYGSLHRTAAALEESATGAIVRLDGKGLIRGYNSAAQTLFGYAPEEVHGRLFLTLLKPGVAPQDGPAGEPFEAQGEARRKDGGTVPVRLRVASSRSDPPQIWMFVEDLTREQLSAQLETENALLWPTFDEAGLMIAMVRRNGGIIRISRAAAQLLNVSEAEAEGRPYWEVFEREEQWVSAQVAFDQAKKTLGPSRIKTEWVRADGSSIPLDWLMLSPAWDEEGDLEHMVVTAAPSSEGSLAARRQMLRVVERVAGRIAGHFENLLSTINGYSELVLHDLSPASPLRKDVEQILAASERASETTRQLLGFSGSRLISTETLDWNVLLERMKRAAHESLRRAIELRLHPDPVLVLGNRRAFEEVLAVLAEYAAGRGGEVVFTTEPVQLSKTRPAIAGDLPPGDYSKLNIALGKGSEEEVLQHFLEPFASPIRGAKHSTVGLAVASGMARSSGGGITLASHPLEHSSENGVTMEIWLPAAISAAETAGAAAEAKLSARAGS